jgi:SAM-dependent methyltransferase
VDAPKQSVAGLFGRAAADYDRVGFFHQVARRLLALAGVSHGMRVLDVACGAGAVLVPAVRLVGPAGLAVGIDVAEPMAAVAASKLQRLSQGRGAVVVMDAERLGLWAGWFDVVCCASAIYLLDGQATAVRGWLEVLRPGGVLTTGGRCRHPRGQPAARRLLGPGAPTVTSPSTRASPPPGPRGGPPPTPATSHHLGWETADPADAQRRTVPIWPRNVVPVCCCWRRCRSRRGDRWSARNGGRS